MHNGLIRTALTSSAICILIGSISINQIHAQDAPWPQFRGPDSNPVAENARLPDRWSTTENVEWSTELPGRGWSSPIVADGKIFVTTVTTEGESKPPQVGTEYSNEYVAELMKQGLTMEEITEKVTARDIELPHEVSLQYYLYCLDLESGDVLWKDAFYEGQPPGGRHRKGSFASETPVTDGEHIYVYITNLGFYAYDLSGKQMWTKELENHPIYLDFGTGSSPILYQNQLIIVHDNEEGGFIASFDKSTGEEIWRTERPVPEGAPAQMPKSGWSTPYLWKNDQRTEIVTSKPNYAISYDLEGNELWRIKATSMAPAASSFSSDGMLMLIGGRGAPVSAIKPGASGDISSDDTTEPNEFVKWSRPQAGPYIPTPAAYQGGLYVLKDNGIFARYDIQSGEETYKTRIKAEGADFTSSVWAANGKIFCLSEQGDTYVLEAGDEYKLSHVNELGEFCMATPAMVGDRLIIRTEKRIYSMKQSNE